jgi:polyribonucleotide nucleotidyltransferase
MAVSDVDCIIAGTIDNIVMVEGELAEASEAEMVDVIKVAHEAIKKQCQFQLDLAAEIPSSSPKREYDHEDHNEDARARVAAFSYDKCREVAKQGLASKEKRAELFGAIKEEFLATLTEEETEEIGKYVSVYFKESMKKAVRDTMLDDNIRLDGRQFDEVRAIWSEVDYLPTAHGSAVFTRGETQSLTTLTLGGKMDEQMIDDVTFKGSTPFMLHYNFPPFSTGEARMKFNVSRREIGHGNLALRALRPVLPEDNPYTIRLVSEILESNGSSSMATVCAGTLALMDGGIQIKAPVTGIAMGLVAENGKFAVLSDILGDEDHLGDMDFKITGTAKGITACQMDIKVDGLPYEVLIQALEQAKAGRLHILDKILETLPAPNAELKPQTPRVEAFNVPNEMIGGIIGPGGKIIQGLQKETNTTITIEELENGEGRVQVLSNNGDDMANALEKLKLIAFPPQVEDQTEYEGVVKSVKDFGCFVEIVPGTDGLIHISEFAWEKTARMSDVCKEGDMLKFKVIGKDPRTRKWKLSRKILLPKPERKEEPKA